MSLEAELRQLIAQGEEALRREGWGGQGKEPLMPQYHMLLRMIARGRPLTDERLDDWLRVARALREQNALAELPDAPDATGSETLLDSPLAVLSARLRRLPDHMLVAVEPAADALTWFALRGGAEPLVERAALGMSSVEGVRAIEQLISQHYSDVERLRDDAPIDDALFAPMLRAAQDAWKTLPKGIAELVAPARTVVYWASPFGNLGEFPFELLHDGTQWLGISHAIARISSWRTLMELLAPNRMPLSLTPRARIVRARDLAGFEELNQADQEIAAVELQLERRGLTSVIDPAPTTAGMRDALDAGVTALHFLGHGKADSLGEYLPLAGEEMLRPQDLSQLSGARSPFVYLSTCELGRSRAGSSGGALGFASRMIEKGVPGVIGCIQPVNDEVALEMARAVYRRPAAMRVSEALAQARQELDSGGYPPATWGAYVLFGDPNLVLPSTSNELQQTRHLTRDWCAEVSRWAALGSETALSRARAALASVEQAEDGLTAEDRSYVDAWLGSRSGTHSGVTYIDRDEFCGRVAVSDPLAGAALRVLLATEALEGVYSRAKPHFVLIDPQAEIRRALHAAGAVHDMIAWPALAIRMAETVSRETAGARLYARRLLDEAEGALQGWVSEEPDAVRLLDSLDAMRGRL